MFNAAVQLGQSRPANTTAAALTQNADNRVEITRLHIANVTASAATFRLFVDQTGGGTFDATTALYWDVSIAAGNAFEWEAPAPGCGVVLNTNAQLGIRSSVASALNFTVWGVAQTAR